MKKWRKEGNKKGKHGRDMVGINALPNPLFVSMLVKAHAAGNLNNVPLSKKQKEYFDNVEKEAKEMSEELSKTESSEPFMSVDSKNVNLVGYKVKKEEKDANQ